MAKMPDATQKLLPESSKAPTITPTQVILHSAVGSGSLYSFFKNSSNLESHFWVGLDGRIEQYMDTSRRADANLDANARAISVETADNGDPDHYPWQPEQIDSLVKIIQWAHDIHNVPIRKCPAWDESGVGYHTMWGAPSHWTPVAKTCPGAARIKQFSSILSLAAKEPDVELTQVQIDAIARRVWSISLDIPDTPFDNWTMAHILSWIIRSQYGLPSDISAVGNKVDVLAMNERADDAATRISISEIKSSVAAETTAIAGVRLVVDALLAAGVSPRVIVDAATDEAIETVVEPTITTE